MENKIQPKKKYYSLLLPFVSGALLVGFLLLVGPADSNFGLSFIPLLLLWVFVYSVVSVLLLLLIKNSKSSIRKIISAFMASITMLAVMFSALGQLELFDVLLLAALVILGIFYFSRTWPK